MASADLDSLAALRAENARLIGLLEANGIAWRTTTPAPVAPDVASSRLSTDEKVALFGRLFRGRTDVFPVRWEAKTSGKSGYSPACANEWRPGVCEKPRVKCGDCGHRELTPLSDAVLFKHLAGDRSSGPRDAELSSTLARRYLRAALRRPERSARLSTRPRVRTPQRTAPTTC